MATWNGPFHCTDCGKPMSEAGTCVTCLTGNRPSESPKPRKNLMRRSTDRKGKGK